MQGEHCAVHVVCLRTCMSPLTTFAIACQLCFLCWTGHCQMPGLLPTGSWSSTNEEAVQPKPPTDFQVQSSRTGKQGTGCYWAPTNGSQPMKSRWMLNSQTKAYQRRSLTRIKTDSEANKGSKHCLRARHQRNPTKHRDGSAKQPLPTRAWNTKY